MNRTVVSRIVTNRAILALVAGLAACASAAVSAAPPPRFPAAAVWNQDITLAALRSDSATIISTLSGLGGFGNGRMQIDFAMRIVQAPAGAPTRTIIGLPPPDGYYSPDCEPPGTAMPVPATAQIEGSSGLVCDNYADDCHLLVVQGNNLYEAYRATASGSSGLLAQCLVIWKLDRVYPANGRGEHCTSADAAGFPMAPLLFNADEVYAAMQVSNGDLGHAIRFILPNPRMASVLIDGEQVPLYVHPGSHAGGPSGPTTTIAYGSRLRLRGDFPVNLYSPAAQVILRTMQHYGIVLADGGNIALTAEDDVFTTHKWSELGISSRIFDQSVPSAKVNVTDFAVIDTGAAIVETYDCVRNADPPPPTPPSQLRGSIERGANAKLPQIVVLHWLGGAANVDVYRDGVFRATLANTQAYQEKRGGNGYASYMVCDSTTATCSNAVTPLLTRYPDPPPKHPQVLRPLPKPNILD
ncbi:MAG TPA: hypothetical protein VKM35_00250 [Arenimonas sp.]|uniref:hypothetical protein n=1 Tax=Arenimonas sp. TaxID=1872635 RepID=UPI002C78D2A8|nr:hypothetical protein [Arenimonas sp.]HMB55621.1 hypothetical protein [Arenimonas sp.]